MKTFLFVCSLSSSLLLSACVVTNSAAVHPYLYRTYALQQTMYVCQIQAAYTAGAQQDRFVLRDPHIFNTECEDSIFNLAYRDKPNAWHISHGDFHEREWLVAKLPAGTQYMLTQYDEPYGGSEAPKVATLTITSGAHQGMQAQWQWYDIHRETGLK